MKKTVSIFIILALMAALCACVPQPPAAPIQTQAILEESAPEEIPAAAQPADPVAEPAQQPEQTAQVPPQEPATPLPTPTPKGGGVIGEEKAKAIALAKVPGATEADLRIHLESDDGRAEYEGEIIYGDTEYDFEIDAHTGQVLEWDAEPWPDRD